MSYIDSYDDAKKKNESTGHCIFCAYPKENSDEENLIVCRGRFSFVILNRFPYASGHLMIVPYRHTSIFQSLTDEESHELFFYAQKGVPLLERIYGAEGFNLGMNIGHAAGAGIDTHLHLHLVPRWNGDTNFMSVTAETRVLPESLSVTREKILRAWDI
ncbi:MAG: HIT domain-containing protein [Synergistaceae bacterium]|nr:HIT domain-containing protein [Synergistaceae bacterium]